MPLTILQAIRATCSPRGMRSGFASLGFVVALAGCASGSSTTVSDSRYDLGAPVAPAGAMNLAAVKVLSVSAPKNLETDSIIYRLQYADALQTASYTNSHWTMSPAELFTQRLRGALASRGPVLSGADPVRAPILQVDLTDFEQIFDAPGESHGEVSARATLSQHGQVVSQRTFVARAPARSGDAAGGAGALAAASDDLIAQMAAWLGAQQFAASQ
jgi:cholesterol transport system auxiliary component